MQTIVLDAIPEFKMEYFAESCCDPALCSPTSKDAAILKLPPITITLAMEEGDSTKKHVTFTIPPEYYWRPSPNRDGSISCRRFGIAEGNSFVLGDVFMDGLYTFHDLDNARVSFHFNQLIEVLILMYRLASLLQPTAQMKWLVPKR